MKNYIITLFFLIYSIHINAQTGIGTTTPINKFEIVATKADPATSGSSANGNLRLGATVGNHVLDFGLSNTSTYSWVQARDKSGYGTNHYLGINPNGGRVGIGTINPDASSILDLTMKEKY